MKKTPCRCCESDVVGVLVFHCQKGIQPTEGQRRVVHDVFTSAIAFVEDEEWAVTGKFSIKGDVNGSVSNTRN